ncbi:MAG: T9SS type A sorting domain-containing protein [Flavobacteriales bacterium]|nr:MAG: T9SS type A sorting domain-containing protein [Flavobacteriales bacterium]
MFMRTTSLLAALLLGAAAFGQHKEKMDLQLRHFLDRQVMDDAEVSLFIHGDVQRLQDAVRRHGGRVTMARPGMVNARVPVTAVRELAGEQAVHHFEFSLAEGRLMNDSARVKNRVLQVHSGSAPLPQGYDGEGVVMGIIDTGLDTDHPDLRDENGVSRVYRYWDQVPQANPQSPAPYGYGTEWTREQLVVGGDGPTDPQGHGTTVTGTAAGNGLANGRHKGVAPKTEIIMVASRMGAPNWAATVADGVKYIFDLAEDLNKPAVINISMGSYGGSHDGKDAAALFIEDLLLARPGRALAAAAGNSNGSFPYHVRTEVGSDTTFTWFQTNMFPAAYNVFDFPNVFFEVWADADDLQDVQFAIGADRVSPSLAFRGHTPFHTVADAMGEVLVVPIVSYDGNTLGTAQYYAQQRGDQVSLQVLIASPDSADHLWRFMSTGDGAFDIWSLTTFTRTANMIGPLLAEAWPGGLPFPSAEEYPAMAHYVAPDHQKIIVDSWACLPDVLTVANYCNEVTYTDYFGVERAVDGVERDIALASSAGPTRDGRVKPDVAATGDVTFAAAPLEAIQWIIDNQVGYKVDPGGMHIRDGGTSQASPVVAGIAALYLQKCPGASTSEIAQAVRKSARGDGFTGTVPNPRWGAGKVDAFGALLNNSKLAVAAAEFCEGQVVEVAYTGEGNGLQWSNGALGNPIQVAASGPVSATSVTASGCLAYSDTVQFTMWPTPPIPTVSADGPVLTASEAATYQWWEGGQPIPEATTQEWTALWPGSYHVQVTDAHGCSAESAPVQVLSVGVHAPVLGGSSLAPNPVRDQLTLTLSPTAIDGARLTVWSADGKLVLQELIGAGSQGVFTLPVQALAPGVYLLRVGDEQGQWSQRFVRSR